MTTPDEARAALDAVTLVPESTDDDTAAGWGEHADAAADDRRYLEEKPPHHVE